LFLLAASLIQASHFRYSYQNALMGVLADSKICTSFKNIIKIGSFWMAVVNLYKREVLVFL